MGNNVHAAPGEDAVLECTASSPGDLDHPPTVTWYKKNTDGEDVFLEASKNCFLSWAFFAMIVQISKSLKYVKRPAVHDSML